MIRDVAYIIDLEGLVNYMKEFSYRKFDKIAQLIALFTYGPTIPQPNTAIISIVDFIECLERNSDAIQLLRNKEL